MSRWTVGDVMTADVLSVDEGMSFREIVDLIERYGVSGLPVVDEAQRVVGVVSEGDLLRKMEYAGGAQRPHLFEGRDRRSARVKAAGGDAREVMTAPAVTALPGTTVVEAAKLMAAAGVKRLPVVDILGRLVGIVTRYDLLKVFLRSDREIHQDVRAELAKVSEPAAAAVGVEVTRGVVTLTGELDRKSLVTAMEPLVERVDGVIDVISQLTYRYNDLEPVVVGIP